MADHRRKFEIHETTPVRSRRNTYRLEPQPWDTDIVDKASVPEYPEVTYVQQPAGNGSTSWRLM